MPPIDHPDSAYVYLTGTGLTHLGSAEGRDRMHKAAAGGAVTDSMRMFTLGVEGGKPAEGEVGAQPEWFYKGDGSQIVGTGAPCAIRWRASKHLASRCERCSQNVGQFSASRGIFPRPRRTKAASRVPSLSAPLDRARPAPGMRRA